MLAQNGHDNVGNAETAASDASSPSSLDGPEPGADDPNGVSGERVVLWLFAILALGVVVAFALFYPVTRPADRDFIAPAALRDLYIPVVAWGILTAIDAHRRERSGWWLYLVAAPVPLLNIALNVMWLRRWRRAPVQLGRWRL